MKSLLSLQENHKTIGAGPERQPIASAQGLGSAHFTRISAHYRMFNNCIISVLGHVAVRTISCLIIFFLTLSAVYSPLFAQSLSRDAKVSLITVSPGEELYSSFGHNALWVSDPMQGIDKVYNYGTFDFRTEGFYIKFMRGTLPYQLSVSPMYYTMYGAQAENRSVTEQVLNLSQNQKQKLYDYLENNYLPQNRQYAYKFFYDNCATRLRDALKAACGDSLVFSRNTIEKEGMLKSFRWWMNKYLGEKPWAKFGMNLAIGLPSDRKALVQEEMYLPDNLKLHMELATIGGQKAVLEHKGLFTKTQKETNTNAWEMLYSPITIFALLGILILLFTNLQQKKAKVNFLFDKIFFGLIGFAGWILLLLWIATDHGVTAWNVNLLWVFPFHLPLIFFLKHPVGKKFVTISLISAILAVVFSVLDNFLVGDSAIPSGASVFIISLIARLNFLRKRV
ncbi:DUF4105 domain-containing protein [Runella sp. CRIBMP]|uniref:Lnb N-terminal periplasmic domain-containing protein n=1 Tax=Runella sp. CRIBMP TaxID=2683261 RepID=UPI0014128F5E|nr:DUF4105 domain-containing protein [Runella sp. CRIBMP]NBB21170.1 DUF4105 domain-containing protein [Runella sp. CRIBMP]